ncbi:putative bifunctional diguanylate cyclase/phosphodiesterase [Jatrophihabitans sp. DSM 45814]
MAHDDKLSAVLSDFARTIVTEFPIQSILDHLVRRIVEILPVSAAAMTLNSDGPSPRYVAASSEVAFRYESLQTDIVEGPRLSAIQSGLPVAAPDLASDERFPHFGPAATALGLAAVFTFPLRHGGGGELGALDLYRDEPGMLDLHDLAVAQTLAYVAAAYLRNGQDRAEARANSDRFRHVELHDPLTGLPNRTLLQQRLEDAAARSRRSHSTAAILFANLDGFKVVNDTYGHRIGDELLVAVANRLADLVRPGDTLARVAGDEFVFLCEDLRDSSDIEGLAKRIDAAFAAPFHLAVGPQVITASVGMAYAGAGEDVSEQLVIDADIAMYQAKRNGGAGHQILDLREALESQVRQSMDAELRKACQADELEVAYQPIVRAADRVVLGAEALLRWTPLGRGPVNPLSMVEVAERGDLINVVGTWILNRACRDRTRWLAEYPDNPLDVAVNVSARQLMAAGFVQTVLSVLAETGMDATALILEITESTFIEDSDRAVGVLADLRTHGIRIALDDFGTGYSSFGYLSQLPIDIVKIDQSFIAQVGQSLSATAIVSAIANLSHLLGLVVIAEGVENQAQHEAITAEGCDSAQGYFYARPVPDSAILAHLGEARGIAPPRPNRPIFARPT